MKALDVLTGRTGADYTLAKGAFALSQLCDTITEALTTSVPPLGKRRAAKCQHASIAASIMAVAASIDRFSSILLLSSLRRGTGLIRPAC
jgi:hypothetical protein